VNSYYTHQSGDNKGIRLKWSSAGAYRFAANGVMSMVS